MSIEEKIALNLMRDVYYPVTACVCLSEAGDVINVHLFDSAFCRLPEHAFVRCAKAVLISHHPDGDLRPTKEDLDNLKRMRELNVAEAQLMIYSEYTGLMMTGE